MPFCDHVRFKVENSVQNKGATCIKWKYTEYDTPVFRQHLHKQAATNVERLPSRNFPLALHVIVPILT